MSTTIAFDTHAYVKKLRDAGVDELQAEIQADALIALVEDRLATKQDVFMLKRDLADVEANLKRDLADVRKDIATIETNLKRDLADVEANLRKDMTTIEANLKRDIKELDVKAETRFREMDAKTETRFREMDAKTETRFREMNAKAEVTKAEIKRDIKEIDVKAETRIKELELRMVIKMGAMILGGIGLLFGLMRAWPLPVQYVSPPTTQEKHIPAPPTPAQLPVPQAR